MKNHSSSSKLPESLENWFVKSPAYFQTGPEFIRQLKRAMDRTECSPGEALQRKQFGELIGVPKSTIQDWLEGTMPDPMRAMLCALERLPEKLRAELLIRFCRPCPRIGDSRLILDSETLSELTVLLKKPCGLTIVCGQNREDCSFVFKAIGNSIRRLTSRSRISGLDLESQDQFAPVPGLLCARVSIDRKKGREMIPMIRSLIRRNPCDLLMLNGVLAAIPELAEEIANLSRRQNVIVAETDLECLSGVDVDRGMISVARVKLQPDSLTLRVVRTD